MSKYILSTLTNHFIFAKYGEKNGPNDIRPTLSRVRIAGGANKPNMTGWGEQSADSDGVPMWTPRGMVTTIKDETYEWLKDNHSFKQFLDMGHLLVMDSDPGDSHKKITRLVEDEMAARDNHSLLLPKDTRHAVKKITVGVDDHIEE